MSSKKMSINTRNIMITQSKVMKFNDNDDYIPINYYDLIEEYLSDFTLNSTLEDIYEMGINTKDATIEFKLSKEFEIIIDRYLLDIEKNFNFEDIRFSSHFIVSKKEVMKEVNKVKHKCLRDKIHYTVDVYEKHLNKIPDKIFIHQEMERLNKYKDEFNIPRLYKDLFLKKNLHNYFDIKKRYILQNTFVDTIAGFLNYEDLLPYLHFVKRLCGISVHLEVEYMLIDNYQDYTKSQLLFLREIFPNSRIILIGHRTTSINPYKDYITQDLMPNLKNPKTIDEEDMRKKGVIEKTFITKIELIECMVHKARIAFARFKVRTPVLIVCRNRKDRREFKNLFTELNNSKKKKNNDLSFIYKDKKIRAGISVISLYDVLSFKFNNYFMHTFVYKANEWNLEENKQLFKIIKQKTQDKVYLYGLEE